MEVLAHYKTETNSHVFNLLEKIWMSIVASDGALCGYGLAQLIGGIVPNEIYVKIRGKENRTSFERALGLLENNTRVSIIPISDHTAFFDVDQLYLGATGFTVRGSHLTLDRVLRNIRKKNYQLLDDVKIKLQNDSDFIESYTDDVTSRMKEMEKNGWKTSINFEDVSCVN